MKSKLFILLVLIVFLVGCTTGQVTKQVCNKPYILVDNDCCLDKDDNAICDSDEKEDTKRPMNKEELAEKTASKFARVWEHRQWDVMYPVFISSLKKLKTKDEFVKIMDFKETESNIAVRLDDVEIENDNVAYAYYSVSSTLVETKAPSMKLVWEDNEWKIDAFATYFIIKELPLLECTDLNKCTTDIYSFTDEKCVHKEFFPCCGNNLCEDSEKIYKGYCKSDCCGDNKCESVERAYTYICDSDCFSETFSLKKRDNKIIYFMDSDYNITVNDVQRKRKQIVGKYVYTELVNITVNDLTLVMDDEDVINIRDNIYLGYFVYRHYANDDIKSTEFELYNKD